MRVLVISSSAAIALLFLGCSSAAQGPEPSTAVKARPAIAQMGSGNVYVADYGRGDIAVLDGNTYALQGKIATSINGPQDVALDSTGNLYVANTVGDDVTEYAPGSAQPKYTYSAQMRGPVTVKVDGSGHVFVVNREWNGTSTINEYKQSSNLPLHVCNFSGQLEGAAIRENGDVLVSYNAKGQGGRIGVYKGGLGGCQVTTFGVHLYSTGSLVLDNAHNVIVPDPNGERVVVIAPPYTRITRRFPARYMFPYHVSINRSNTTVLLTDVQKNILYVVDYASGRILKKLDDAQGVSEPYGAVRAPD